MVFIAATEKVMKSHVLSYHSRYVSSIYNLYFIFKENISIYNLIYITKIYQHNIHSGIKSSPYSKWKEGIFGTKYTPGIGYPQIPGDIESLTIDFLPSIERVFFR